MARRSYNRWCPLSSALDIVGERWTLLIVNELLISPRRYGELDSAFSGMGSNVLSNRLRLLEEEGVVRRRALPGPGSGVVYELTERGQKLDAVVHALRDWGVSELLNAPGLESQYFDMSYIIPADFAEDLDEIWQWEIDDVVFHLHLRGADMWKHPGPASSPALVYRTNVDTLLRMGALEITEAQAIEQGLIELVGEEAEYDRMMGLLGDPPRRAKLILDEAMGEG